MKKIALLVICLFVLLYVGCGHIEDTNGPDDFSLVEISDEDIINGRSFTSNASFKSTVNGVHKLTINKFSGVQSLLTINTDSSKTVEILITNAIKEGNLTIVLVNNDKIIERVTLNASFTKTITFTGEFNIKIAGESANFNIEYSVKEWR